MPRRPANITQADIARTLRAMRDAGLSVTRVVVRPDGGVSVETTEGLSNDRVAVEKKEPETWPEHIVM